LGKAEPRLGKSRKLRLGFCTTDAESQTISFLQKATKITKEAGQIFNASFPWLPLLRFLPRGLLALAALLPEETPPAGEPVQAVHSFGGLTDGCGIGQGAHGVVFFGWINLD
jgi:hypothetical protein